MATEKQVDANRRNAQYSTGPKTPEGKAAMSLNALKHGIYARPFLIPGENTEEFNALLSGLAEQYKPVGPQEETIVLLLAYNIWKSLRLERLESALYHQAFGQITTDRINDIPMQSKSELCETEEYTLGVAAGRVMDGLSKLPPYMAELRKARESLLDELLTLQSERMQHVGKGSPEQPDEETQAA